MVRSTKIFQNLIVTLLILSLGFIFMGMGKRPSAEQIKIGWIGPLSGQYASYGKMVKAGTDIALEEINASGGINGKELVILYEDDQLEPKNGVAAFNKLVSLNKVPVVIQAAGSNVMLAQAPIAERQKVVLISPTCTNPKITYAGDYVFRIAPSDTYQGKVIAELAYNDLNAKKAAVLYINNDYGVGLKDVFISNFKELGGVLTNSEGFAPGTNDFRTILGKIRDSKPDVVFLSSLYQEAALILKQAKELGISIQFLGGDGCFSPELIARAGNSAEGMIVINMHWNPDSNEPIVKKFISKFKEKEKQDPEVYAALGYDCLRVVAHSIKKAEQEYSTIQKALSSVVDLSGVTGPTIFDKNGDVLKKFDIFVVKNKKFIVR